MKTQPSSLAETLERKPNSFPIDDAAILDLGQGVKGRYGDVPIGSLTPNPKNARQHSRSQIKKLARSAGKTGFWSPIIADEKLLILAGHARLEAAKLNGCSTVPIIQVLGANEAQKRAYLLADNRIAEDGGWDRQKLALELPELSLLFEDTGFELADLGFEVAEFDGLAVDFADTEIAPEDRVDDSTLEGPAVLRRGDLVELGDHLLLVGDARSVPDLDRLCGDRRAAAAFLDVPYNVSIADVVGRGRVSHREFEFASGEMSKEEFREFLRSAMRNAARVSKLGAVHYVCMDWKHVVDLVEAGQSEYQAFLNLVVWNKTNAGQGGFYRSQHEFIGVFRVGDEPHLDNVQKGKFGRNRSNVWTYPGANTFRAGRAQDLADHPTVKPVQLVADALKDCTKRGDYVLDTFVGSGTTILAAEKVGRRALAMEIDPKYADVAVRRWQKITGRDAVHVDTGKCFQELIEMGRPITRTRVRRGSIQ